MMGETKRERWIRKLEGTLKSDLMSVCHEAFFTEEAIKGLVEILKNETGGWIPCSERLPERWGEECITTRTNPRVGRVGADVYDPDYWERLGVTAWMPLPEPYREDGEE